MASPMAGARIFSHQLRVRYAETDAMGVAHHSAYVPWLEEARIEALRQLGHSYKACEAAGVLMPVVDLHLQYRASLSFDDELCLLTSIEVRGPSRVVFHTRIQCGDRHCADAQVMVACVAADGRPRRLPDELRSALLAAAAPS
ncbi:MAG: acyl-CoA thioesterase [Planctomycetota bacterium]|nr:MAG: acyl-CoA thioesterase [Planctomycetota bacterium]